MQIAIVNCEVSTNHYQEVVSLFSFGESHLPDIQTNPTSSSKFHRKISLPAIERLGLCM